MKSQNKYLLFLLFGIVLMSLGFITSKGNYYSISNISITQKNIKKQYKAGEKITLQFKNEKRLATKLSIYLQSSWGNVVLTPEETSETILFIIPSFINTKSGVVRWHLVSEKREVITGKFTINPSTETTPLLETYVGPQSIVAGGIDYTMLVTIPTDPYDNLVADSTVIKTQTLSDEMVSEKEIKTKKGFAWKTIISPNKKGKLFVGATTQTSTSKEMVVTVAPSNPVDFFISENRVHPFADGNEITEITTSVLKDSFGNIIADGTLVTFHIKEASGTELKTAGTTINGVAKGKILHPSQQSIYEVKAQVEGLAESNSLTIKYKSAIKDIPLLFTSETNVLTIGPIETFLGQIVPEGTEVILKINDQVIILETEKGVVKLEFPPINITEMFEIMVLGSTLKTSIETFEKE